MKKILMTEGKYSREGGEGGDMDKKGKIGN
jgi:hypothetical protein